MIVVCFSNDWRKEGVVFPENVGMSNDEYGNIAFNCTHIQLEDFISNNKFVVRETHIFENGTGKQNDILLGDIVVGTYWNSIKEYEQFKEDTFDYC